MSGRSQWPLLMTLFLMISCGGGGSSGNNSGGAGPPSPATHFVSTSAGAGGVISPTSASVQVGLSASFTISPSAGYGIDGVTGCSGTLAGNTYTTGAITQACTVTASFRAIHQTVAHCLSTADELVATLGTVGHSGGTELVKLATGTYGGNFLASISAGSALILEGGYLPGCQQKDPAGRSELNGERNGRVIVVETHGAARLEIRDLTIRHGRAESDDPSCDCDGAGLYVAGELGEVIIERSLFVDNGALGSGGGVYADVDAIMMRDSDVQGNSGNLGAGAALICRECGVERTVFRGNRAQQITRGPAKGGGLYIERGNTSVTDCEFGGNVSSNDGGGLYSAAPNSLLVVGSIFRENRAARGGGAYLGGTASSQISVLASRFVRHDDCETGCGIEIRNAGETRLVNNLLASNTHTHRSPSGAAVLIDAGLDTTRAFLTNNSIVGNWVTPSTLAGAVVVTQRANGALVEIKNNAISHNSFINNLVAYIDDNNDGINSPLLLRNNAFDVLALSVRTYPATEIDESNIEIDYDAYVHLPPTDQNRYDSTWDLRPAAGSPLIDAGMSSADVPLVDILGNARDARPDVGAYEHQGN